MFSSVQLDHTLYTISNAQLQNFKKLANEYISVKSLDEIPLRISNTDKCCMILHIWCLLNEENYNFIYLPQKMMIYSSDFYCIELIKTNKDFSHFKKHIEHSYAQQLLFAYVLCKSIAGLLQEIVQQTEHINLHSIGIHSYYTMHLNNPEISEEDHPIYHWHRYFSRMIHQHFTNNAQLEVIIRHSIDTTKNLFTNIKPITS